ncbi:MAG: type II secretion system major pseudopilin GspG [Phycisphaerales bacterium]
MKKNETRRRRRGFTIIEVLVIITIMGIIAAVVVPRLFSRIGQSRQATAESNAASIAGQVQVFLIDMGKLPDTGTLEFLRKEPSGMSGTWNGPYISNDEMLIDPWGNPYIIVAPGEKNTDFDIVSYGADGQPGGEGEDADIIKP